MDIVNILEIVDAGAGVLSIVVLAYIVIQILGLIRYIVDNEDSE
jgi:hypothetical protein